MAMCAASAAASRGTAPRSSRRCARSQAPTTHRRISSHACGLLRCAERPTRLAADSASPVRRCRPWWRACSTGQPSGFSANAPTSLARGDRPARARRGRGTDALPRRHHGEHHGPSNPHRPMEREDPAGLRPARRPIGAGPAPLCAAPVQTPRRDQEERGVRQVLRRMPGPASRQLPQTPETFRRTRRLSTMRISPAAAGRLPLCPVPRGPRHRARAEAPGRHRRGGHRRVRGQAGQGARAVEPRLRRQSLERPRAAGTVLGLLGAAPGSRAEIHPGMEALDQRQWMALFTASRVGRSAPHDSRTR